ncbi:glyoxalase [Mesobacillus campisalis]|uniref:Glyoxalase n=2 Tax=Mesobacillus campisalis TaxID=1408103 RepID=A0A0M2SWY7_9BACI|nr:VOC family protein [Mesobacillus campisalis]KKK38231.1 glyoxalase [Mesobacillus campisalis]
MPVAAYLNFDGNCREAVEFYGKVFGSEPYIMTFGESPQSPDFPMPEEAKDRVMHARINVCGSNVMFSDIFPGMSFVQGNNVSLAVMSNNLDELQTYFDQLKEGGKVQMELQETFWSKCYGTLVDRYGIHWQISYEA